MQQSHGLKGLRRASTHYIQFTFTTLGMCKIKSFLVVASPSISQLMPVEAAAAALKVESSLAWTDRSSFLRREAASEAVCPSVRPSFGSVARARVGTYSGYPPDRVAAARGRRSFVGGGERAKCGWRERARLSVLQ